MVKLTVRVAISYDVVYSKIQNFCNTISYDGRMRAIKMKKKLLIMYVLTVIVLCIGVCAGAVPPTLESQAACLMDADTGEVLFEQNADVQLPPASITKVMTALVVLENGNLNDAVTATAEAINSVYAESTRIGFEPGEQLTVDELMYCMMVNSANDAANILAEHVGGTLNAFIAMMNEKAAELGCTNTHFANPNGLDEDGHYSCAYDMALIAQAANQYPEFAKYAGAIQYQLPTDNIISENWSIYTKVDMLCAKAATYDARVYAGKTGWTTNAHNTFVACAKSGDTNLIVTVMNSAVKSGIFTDTTALLNYAEQAYARVEITPDAYKQAAQEAAQAVSGSIDTDALRPFALHLPAGMGVDDLSYTCAIPQDGNAYLAVTIAEGSRRAYQDATGLDGMQTLLRLPVALTAVDRSIWFEGETVESWLDVEHMPDETRHVLLLAVGVVGTVLLLLVILLVRTVRRKAKHRERNKEYK